MNQSTDKTRSFPAFLLLTFAAVLFFSASVFAAPTLSRSAKAMMRNTSYSLTVKGTKKTVRWRSSDKSIVNVAQTGSNKAVVTSGSKCGIAVITAKVGKKKLQCTIFVSKTGKKYRTRLSLQDALGHNIKGTWKKNNTRYRDLNGLYLTSTFACIDGSVYYFDQTGTKRTGFFQTGDHVYFADENGKVTRNSFPIINGSHYAFDENGWMVTSREVAVRSGSTTKYYYYGNNGKRISNLYVGASYYGTDGSKMFNLDDEFKKSISTKNLSSYTYLYIGASKPSYIGDKLNNMDKKTFFNCVPGETIRFFYNGSGGKEALIPVIRKFITDHPQKKQGIIITEMSGNDLEHLNGYIGIYKYIMAQYPYARFAYVDMLPGDGEEGKAKNIIRQSFNATMKSVFGAWNGTRGCIGGYNEIIKYKDFKTVDGTHYYGKFMRITYEYVMKAIGRPIEIVTEKAHGTGILDEGKWLAVKELTV